jgi:hypothetical protein
MSFLLSQVFSSTKPKRAEQVVPGNGVGGWREVAQTMYTHVSKCKIDKIKGGEKKEPHV